MVHSVRGGLQDKIRKIVFTVLGFCVFFVAAGQELSKNKPKPPKPPKPPRSDNKGPKGHGLIMSSLATGTTILTPSGWGSTEKYAFITAGGTPNQLYSTLPDMFVRAGFGIGDSRKTVSAMGMVNFNDVSTIGRNLSTSFVVSRALGKTSSISVGGQHLFRNQEISDGVQSYYIAFSSGVKGVREITPGNPRLSYTLGFGSGNFLTQSPADVVAGKGEYGTGLFASVSYDVLKNVSMNAEWTGMNLGITGSYRLPKNFGVVYAGVAELTNFSGDNPMFVMGVGKAFGIKKK